MSATFQVREAVEFDRNRERMSRMAQVVEQFATRLTLRPVRVRVADSGLSPAWSTSNTISFNGSQIGNLLDPSEVSATRGLALHEVSHILFTPRAGSDILQWVLDQKFGRAFNALEDQRIETLMVGRFGSSVVDWFTLMVSRHLVNNPDAIGFAFPLVRGRKYLPVELRKLVRSAYVRQDNVGELSAIIDEYRTLLFPQDTDKAKPLIERYSQLVNEAKQDEAGQDSGWSETADAHADRPAGEQESTVKSKPLSKSEQERARDNARARQEQSEDDAPESEEEFDFGDGDSDWEDEQEEDADQGSNSVEPQQSDSDGDGESDTNSDSTDGMDSTSTPNAPAGTTGDSSITDLAQDIMDEVMDRLADQIAEDISKFNGDVELEGERVATPRSARSHTATVSEMAIRASKSFGHELERLRSDFDPAWERRTSSGRINAQRYMTGVDLDEVFDRWSEGRDDAVDIEAVILLDTSGSMDSQATHAYESMWALKRALDRVNANCTVITFASEASVLYSAEERASNTVKNAGTGGGTSPLQAIKYSTKVLADSSRAVKVMFTITDGEWSNSDECDKLIQRLRDGGVMTALAYISGAWDGDGASNKHHGCEVFSHIRSSADLFVLGRQLVKVATQRNLAH